MKTETSRKPEYLIDTKSVQDGFEKELNQYNGSARIFFSGKYGVGKTKFLERFFDARQDEYLRIHLFPVNYQIYNNLDIIELLKADIIIELLKQDVNFQNNSELTLFEYLKQYTSLPFLLQKGLEYGKELVPTEYRGVLNVLGKSLQDGQKLAESFHKTKKGDSGVIEKYLEESKEPDIISSIVHKTIKGINDKKSVLIIDDLDRLDPEHIFRILNVLSAHFDQDGDNKFGFDYIIIVGDYHNIQSIFHHKYGEKADFDGYIDKFYTVKPFEFDNRQALLEQLPDIIQQYQREDSPKNNLDYSYFIIQDIIRKTISLDIINLRKLLKHTKIKLVPVKDKISNIPIDSSYLFTTVDILIDMFETKDSLISRIQKIKDSNIYDGFEFEAELYKYRSIIRELYIIIHPNKINPKQASPSQYAEYGKYMLVFEGSHYGETVTIKQQSLDQNYKNLYYDLLIDFINNKFDEIKK